MAKRIHELKLLTPYYSSVKNGYKRFELRKNDRDFHVGDILRLKEWDGHDYTGESMDVCVTYVLLQFQGLERGYCIMSIDPI